MTAGPHLEQRTGASPSDVLDGATPIAYVDGTHRSVTPRDTLRRIAPHLGEFGITRVANITGLDRVGIPVYVAVRPNARSLSVSQGKGVDRDAAKASAIGESVEAQQPRPETVMPLHDVVTRDDGLD